MNDECIKDLLEIIKSRRSVRNYLPGKPIPEEALRKILQAGIWSPSGSNIQPWEFILLSDENNIENVIALSPGIFSKPSAIVILCVNRERAKKGGAAGEVMALMDIAIAAQNIMLEAHFLGIGSCPVMSFSKAGIKELLNIPEHVEPVLMITLGYPAEKPLPPRRRSFEDVMHLEGW